MQNTCLLGQRLIYKHLRTRKEPKITLNASHLYPEAGRSTVLLKVIDILGNDTTKTPDVEVP